MNGRDRKTVVVRGGGDLASGTIWKLHRCGYKVFVLETAAPSAIRRKVAFSEAMYDGEAQVEGIVCKKANNLEQAEIVRKEGNIPILEDSNGSLITKLRPFAVVDAILAKKNIGTSKSMAPVTIALGPGFTAGIDVDAVVETKRGHNLGRIYYKGSAAPNTGIPGIIAGYGKERVIHSPAEGILHQIKEIGCCVKKGEKIAEVGEEPVLASLDGILRGVIRDGYQVKKGMKIADIDPRMEQKKNCDTISDKARCIAGGVLEALIVLSEEMERKGEME
ncbi:MAG: selenium-dependent molybdenum cofactor biosynthesis protein YqeB [Eubacteriales bacterium]|nr:selenium-dependent molybdenum cofactor biosynthesis protein YqeB [Eubacteriales bacterium]